MHWLFELSMFVNILGTNIVAALGEKYIEPKIHLQVQKQEAKWPFICNDHLSSI